MFRLFRSRGGGEEPAREPADVADDVAGVAGGPYDAATAPRSGGAVVDLGSLRLPDIDGVTLEFPVQESSSPTAVVVRAGAVAMGLAVFAAPKSRGLWDEVRAEMTLAAGEDAVTVAGRYGPELHLPGRHRVIGIDGPRWFLRVVVTPTSSRRTVRPAGSAANSLTGSAVLDEVLRGLVVVRGTAAVPPGAARPLCPPGTADPDPPGATPADAEILRPTGTATAEARAAGHELAPPFTHWLSHNVIGVG